MRALLPALLLAALGCADEEPARVAVTKQSVLIYSDAGPRATGANLGSRLGKVITTCPGGGWVAGATGDDSIYVSSLRAHMRSGRPYFVAIDPLPLACLGENGTLRILMGGPNNTWAVFPDGGSLSVYTQRADSFDVSKGYLALGDTLWGTIRVYSNAMTATALTNPSFTSAPATMGVGNSVSWSSNGDLLMGASSLGAAGVYPADTTIPDAGRLQVSAIPLINPGASSDFGRVVLVGDVHPASGEEYIIAAPSVGRVYIFSGTAVVDTLQGGTTFGAALALEPASFGGLHALWVGEPGSDRVYRFFGGEGTVFEAPPEGDGAFFGAAIAVDGQGVVAIGAPEFDDGALLGAGTVFEAYFDGGPTSGQMTQCVAGQSCMLPGCTTGLCVNGVFCQQTRDLGSDCATNERCVSNACTPVFVAPDAGKPDAGEDAGAPDAGEPDAGEPDAGEPDAGLPDAGAPDAGLDAGVDPGVDAGVDEPDAGLEEQIFKTRGCTTGGLPLLALALVLFRRRRITAAR